MRHFVKWFPFKVATRLHFISGTSHNCDDLSNLMVKGMYSDTQKKKKHTHIMIKRIQSSFH